MNVNVLAASLICLLLSFEGMAQIVPTQPEEPATPVALPTTTVEFDESQFDFGIIDEGEQVSHVFQFTNTGDLPLIISKAKGSCGCTVPFYPKVPILPGEISEIEVVFNSKNKKGAQSKRVTITANTEPANTFLSISGEVIPSEDENEVYEESILRNKEEQDLQAFDSNCFAIYPNPTNEVLQLELKDHIGKSATVDILNEKGQKILDKKIERISSQSTRFDVSSFAPGIYLISIRVDNAAPMTQCFVVTAH